MRLATSLVSFAAVCVVYTPSRHLPSLRASPQKAFSPLAPVARGLLRPKGGATHMDHSPRVLLADDDVPLRNALAEALTLAGFEVGTAASVETVCALLVMEAFDVVLSDVAMPGDGATLPRLLGRMFPGVPVILMTGLEEPGIRHRALEDGAVDFLRKPVALSELRTCLIRALNRASA